MILALETNQDARFRSPFRFKGMRNILFSTFGAFLVLAALSGCSTSVKTDSGHGVTAGVHDTGHGVTAGVHAR